MMFYIISDNTCILYNRMCWQLTNFLRWKNKINRQVNVASRPGTCLYFHKIGFHISQHCQDVNTTKNVLYTHTYTYRWAVN
jgi:hypothetical protein